jgi:hypothetical protein
MPPRLYHSALPLNSHPDGRLDAQFGFVVSTAPLRCSGGDCGSSDPKRWKANMRLNTEEEIRRVHSEWHDTIVTRDLSALVALYAENALF